MKESNIHPKVYTFPTVKPIDEQIIKECAQSCKTIFTVEEHNIVSGFGSAVSEVVASLKGNRANIVRLGLNDTYSSIVGSQKYLRDYYGISAQKIADMIVSSL